MSGEVKVDSASAAARDCIIVSFSHMMVNSGSLLDPNSYTCSGTSVVSVGSVPLDSVRYVILHVSTLEEGRSYEVVVDTSVVSSTGENLDVDFSTAEFVYEETKLDRILRSFPTMYEGSHKSNLRAVLQAVAREDDLIGGVARSADTIILSIETEPDPEPEEVFAWEKLETLVAEAGQSSFTFTSALDGDEDREYRIRGFFGMAAPTLDYFVRVVVNGEPPDHSRQLTNGTTTTPSTTSFSDGSIFRKPAVSGPTTAAGCVDVTILVPTGFVRVCRGDAASERAGGSNSLQQLQNWGWRYSNVVDNIISLSVAVTPSDGLVAGSQFVLYRRRAVI